jgi:hypothetical protein
MLVHLSEVVRDMTLASHASIQGSVLHMGHAFFHVTFVLGTDLHAMYLLTRAFTVFYLPDDTLGPLLVVKHSSKLDGTF